MCAVSRVNLPVVGHHLDSFGVEKNNFNSSSYSTFKSSYLNGCGDPYVSKMASNMNNVYSAIDNGYSGIYSYWNIYVNNLLELERKTSNKSNKFGNETGSVFGAGENNSLSSASEVLMATLGLKSWTKNNNNPNESTVNVSDKYNTADMTGAYKGNTSLWKKISNFFGDLFDTDGSEQIVLPGGLGVASYMRASSQNGNDSTNRNNNKQHSNTNTEIKGKKDVQYNSMPAGLGGMFTITPIIQEAQEKGVNTQTFEETMNSTGASIGNGVVALNKGISGVVEAALDALLVVGNIIATVPAVCVDIFANNALETKIYKEVDAIWNETKRYVARQNTEEVFEKFYENDLGKTLNENAYDSFKNDGTVYQVIEEVGTTAGIIGLGVLTGGASLPYIAGGVAFGKEVENQWNENEIVFNSEDGELNINVNYNELLEIRFLEKGESKKLSQFFIDEQGIEIEKIITITSNGDGSYYAEDESGKVYDLSSLNESDTIKGVALATLEGIEQGIQWALGSKIANATFPVITDKIEKDAARKIVTSGLRVFGDAVTGAIEAPYETLKTAINENISFKDAWKNTEGINNLVAKAISGAVFSSAGELFDFFKKTDIPTKKTSNINFDEILNEYLTSVKDQGISFEEYLGGKNIKVARIKDESELSLYMGDKKLFLLNKMAQLINVRSEFKKLVGNLPVEDIFNNMGKYLNDYELNNALIKLNKEGVDRGVFYMLSILDEMLEISSKSPDYKYVFADSLDIYDLFSGFSSYLSKRDLDYVIRATNDHGEKAGKIFFLDLLEKLPNARSDYDDFMINKLTINDFYQLNKCLNPNEFKYVRDLLAYGEEEKAKLFWLDKLIKLSNIEIGYKNFIVNNVPEEDVLNNLSNYLTIDEQDYARDLLADHKGMECKKFVLQQSKRNDLFPTYMNYKSSSVADLNVNDMFKDLNPYLTKDEINWFKKIVDISTNYNQNQLNAVYNYTACGGLEICAFLNDIPVPFKGGYFDSIAQIQDSISEFEYISKSGRKRKNRLLKSESVSIEKCLDSVIEQANYDDAIVTYRGVRELFNFDGMDNNQITDLDNLKIGDTFVTRAYQSSSILAKNCYGFDDSMGANIVLEIIVPPNSATAAYIENITGCLNYCQTEMLIKRNAKMTVVGDVYKQNFNGVWKTIIPVTLQ